MKCVFNALVGSLSVLSLLSLSACGKGVSPSAAAALSQNDEPVTSNPDEPSLPVVDPVPESRNQVVKGWLDDYSNHIENRVSDNYPALLDLSKARMDTVCPNWGSLSAASRVKFWSALLYSIAGPESGRNRTAIYSETTMSIDAVTGLQIRSEGLLQLSYVDVSNYKYAEGDISWAHDKTMALADYSAGVSSGNAERTILNAYANLNLGLFIMNRLVAIHPTEDLDSALGRYWSTMRSANATFQTVLSGLRTKIPSCF